jgi:hypothetical protein
LHPLAPPCRADDQLSKLTAEIETLEKRRDKETTSLADFVDTHSAQQSGAHGDVLTHLDKQLQEHMAEHATTVRQSLEAERGKTFARAVHWPPLHPFCAHRYPPTPRR